MFGLGKEQAGRSGDCGGTQFAYQMVQAGEDDPDNLEEIARFRAQKIGCRGEAEIAAYVENFVEAYQEETEALDDQSLDLMDFETGSPHDEQGNRVPKHPFRLW